MAPRPGHEPASSERASSSRRRAPPAARDRRGGAVPRSADRPEGRRARSPRARVAAGCHERLNGIVKLATLASGSAASLELRREGSPGRRRIVGHRRREQQVEAREDLRAPAVQLLAPRLRRSPELRRHLPAVLHAREKRAPEVVLVLGQEMRRGEPPCRRRSRGPSRAPSRAGRPLRARPRGRAARRRVRPPRPRRRRPTARPRSRDRERSRCAAAAAPRAASRRRSSPDAAASADRAGARRRPASRWSAASSTVRVSGPCVAVSTVTQKSSGPCGMRP